MPPLAQWLDGHVKACFINPNIACGTKRPVCIFFKKLSHRRKQAIIPRPAEGVPRFWHGTARTVTMKKWKRVESCPVSLTPALLAFPHMSINTILINSEELLEMETKGTSGDLNASALWDGTSILSVVGWRLRTWAKMISVGTLFLQHLTTCSKSVNLLLKGCWTVRLCCEHEHLLAKFRNSASVTITDVTFHTQWVWVFWGHVKSYSCSNTASVICREVCREKSFWIYLSHSLEMP